MNNAYTRILNMFSTGMAYFYKVWDLLIIDFIYSKNFPGPILEKKNSRDKIINKTAKLPLVYFVFSYLIFL